MKHLFPSAAFLLAGCTAVGINELQSPEALEVRLDANATAYGANPARRIKFFVDVTNRSGSTINLSGLKVELRALPDAASDAVLLREEWTYRWPQKVLLKADRKLSVPILPERPEPGGVPGEFPLHLLTPGDYRIIAVVNDRHLSSPYRLKILRPELGRSLAGRG
jgi:hypothetical protein